MHTRQRASRYETLLTFCATLSLSGLLVAGCSSGQAGNAAVPLTPATGAPTSVDSFSAAREAGSVRGEVTAIEVFTDPGSQIHANADLAAYLLPGLSGDGVQCAEDALDPETILGLALEEARGRSPASSWNVLTGTMSEALWRCTRWASKQTARTVSAKWVRAPPQRLPRIPRRRSVPALESIYLARLDLAAPPTSPGIATEFLQAEFRCLVSPTTLRRPSP